jgi:hypothetical protein
MAVRFSALLLVGFLTASLHCFGQEVDREVGLDPSLTREQWQERVEDARRRSGEFVANRRARSDSPMTRAEAEAEAADRALKDSTLQPGDVISTGKGFVVFVGRDERHGPRDFLSAPPRHPPEGGRAGSNHMDK